MFKLKKIAGVMSAVAVTSVLTATSAFAEVDVSGITETVSDVTSIGAAIMGVLVAIAAIKYVRRAL